MKTVVGLFDSFDEARGVMDEILALGIRRDMLKIENTAKGEHAFHMHGESEVGDTSASLLNGLTQAGVPSRDGQLYAEGVRRGGTLLICTCDDTKATQIYELMGRHGAIDLDERMTTWTKSGWTGLGQTHGEKMTAKTTELRQGEQILPVIEEELKVGKREVQKGGVRVYSHVTEVPVQEQVHLREEHVHVERRPVDRAVSERDMAGMRDQTIELREKSEEAVVSKRARVIEEVVIGKTSNERVETVNDTLKRTDVKVEKLAGETVTSGVRYEEFDNDYRTHFNGLGLQGHRYEDYQPVYRFGHSLGTHERYGKGDWTSIEPDARRHWEERNPGSWAEFKESIRFAWERARGRR